MMSDRDEDFTKPSNARELERILTLLLLASSKIEAPEYAIKKIDSIRLFARKRAIEFNAKSYSAMILAYGKAGGVYEAFNVVDEMTEKRIKLTDDVFSNLLCAAISQPEKGFHYALKVTSQLLLPRKCSNSELFKTLSR